MDERGSVAIFRVVDILELLRDHPKGLPLSKVALSLNLPKSTTHRLLATLVSRGIVRQDNDNEVYKLGFSILRMATSLLDGFDITSETRVILERLNKEWDEAVHLSVIDETEKNMVYILKLDSTKTVRMVSQIGRAVPIHCTSLGKAFMSCYSNELIINKMSGYEFKKFTPNSITNLEQFINEIELTRKRGFSIDQGENDYYVYCVGAPITNFKNEPLAAISISVPSDRFDESKLLKYGESIIQVSHEISNQLQYIPA
ncbi:MAG: IclR family transcriptional regulator [Anaerolineaceae bacterium]